MVEVVINNSGDKENTLFTDLLVVLEVFPYSLNLTLTNTITPFLTDLKTH